jgi:hypothetical protein
VTISNGDVVAGNGGNPTNPGRRGIPVTRECGRYICRKYRRLPNKKDRKGKEAYNRNLFDMTLPLINDPLKCSLIRPSATLFAITRRGEAFAVQDIR